MRVRKMRGNERCPCKNEKLTRLVYKGSNSPMPKVEV